MASEDFDSTKLDQYLMTWQSVVHPIFGWHHRDSPLVRILCYYCQWCLSHDEAVLPKKIAQVKNAIQDPARYGLAGHEFCQETGEFVLVKTDGTRVPSGTTFEEELSDDEMIEFFGAEFLSKVDRKWHRNKLINDLIDGEDNGRGERDVQDKEGLDIRQGGQQD